MHLGVHHDDRDVRRSLHTELLEAGADAAGERDGFERTPQAEVVGDTTIDQMANHLTSFGGTNATADVNATFLQPFLSYTTKTYTAIGLNTESTYDWEDTKWTVPLNPFVSQVLKVAGHPISLLVGPKLYVEGPTGAPDWGIRFAFILLFPK